MALLEMKQITKVFGKVTANDNIDFSVEKGEVHALLGENGAGKSTLMNILYGMYGSYDGEIRLDGKKVVIHNPKKAIKLGIGMVHQHFMLIPALTAIENVVLGLKENKTVLNLPAAAKRFTEMAEKYNMKIDPWVKVEQLSIGQQQRLEILKALYRNAKLLILDEPTAVLTPSEVDSLFEMMELLKKEGATIIFISHKLNEIMKICDRCTVLRMGRLAATVNVSDVTDNQQLAALMIGKNVVLEADKTTAQLGQERLRVENLCCLNERKLPALKDVSFSLRDGEILGICGVDGNGQSELIRCITGLLKPTSGTIQINSVLTNGLSPRKILNMGVSHIPEDRHKYGMIKKMTVEENLMLVSYDQENFSKMGFLNKKKIREYAKRICTQYGVKTPGTTEFAGNLSGGNQQKFVVGRELDRNPKLLIAVHPSRGLDIGATKYIQSEVIVCRDRGAAVLLVSTELDELLELSDRILVMYEGRVMGIMEYKDASREVLGPLMVGTKS